MKKLAAALAALLCIQYSGAAGLPDLGDSSRVSLSEQQEDQIGREIMSKVRDDAAWLDDPVVEEYLANLGEKLASHSPEPGRHFEFFPVRDASINAFALPGGYVGVHTGLISAARSESELASVLSHEIAHVTQNHIARMVGAEKVSGLATLAALAVAILAARSNSQVAEAAIVTAQAMNMQSRLDFTREHEKEADRTGLTILSDAGYSPQGMATFFERLQAQGRLYENNAPAYLRTHPLTYQRIADMQDRLSRMPYRQHQDSAEFLFVRARIQADEGEAGDALKRFEESVREPAHQAAWYGLARAAQRAGRPERSRQALERLDPAQPLVAALRAELDLARGGGAELLEPLARAVAAHPGYRPLVYLQIRALLAAGRTREALDRIEAHRRLWQADARLHALRAEAHQALGQMAQSHLAQAEAYALRDQTGAAIEQLLLAQKVRGADFHTLSIVDARLRELRQRQPATQRP